MNIKGHARISSVGSDKKADYKFSTFLPDVVTQTEEGISLDLPEGFTLPDDAHYVLEMWIPRASCDPTNVSESYTYVTDTNSPALRALWEEQKWENIAALSNSHGRQVMWPSAEELRPHMGKWVAIMDAEVIFSDYAAAVVFQYLRDNDLRADSLFRVPMAGEHDER